MFKKYFGVFLTPVIGAALALVTLALPAHATTADCQAAYGNACGTFSSVDKEMPTAATVFMDLRASVIVNGVVIGYSANSAADQATDFTRVQHIGHVNSVGLSNATTKSYSFVFTPHGRWTNECLSDPNDGTGVTVKPCNGLQWQRWFASNDPTSTPPEQIGISGFNGDAIFGTGTHFALQNAASRQFLSDDAIVPPGVRPSSPPDTRQLVTSSAESAGPMLSANQIWAWLP